MARNHNSQLDWPAVYHSCTKFSSYYRTFTTSSTIVVRPYLSLERGGARCIRSSYSHMLARATTYLKKINNDAFIIARGELRCCDASPNKRIRKFAAPPRAAFHTQHTVFLVERKVSLQKNNIFHVLTSPLGLKFQTVSKIDLKKSIQ